MTADEMCSPIDSLIQKSKNAIQKLQPETWQYRMLDQNLKALNLACALIREAPTPAYPHDTLAQALKSFHSMIKKTEGALPKFPPGTSQNTLLQNRLMGLRVAEARIIEIIKNEPNKAMEPIPVNVTIPANAGLAPFTSMAHL